MGAYVDFMLFKCYLFFSNYLTISLNVTYVDFISIIGKKIYSSSSSSSSRGNETRHMTFPPKLLFLFAQVNI